MGLTIRRIEGSELARLGAGLLEVKLKSRGCQPVLAGRNLQCRAEQFVSTFDLPAHQCSQGGRPGSVSFLGIGPGGSEDGFGLGVMLERGQPAYGGHANTRLGILRGLLQGMTKRFVAALRSGAGRTRKSGVSGVGPLLSPTPLIRVTSSVRAETLFSFFQAVARAFLT